MNKNREKNNSNEKWKNIRRIRIGSVKGKDNGRIGRRNGR